MELSNSKIKKFLIFSQKSPHPFQPKLEKIKKIHPEKKFLVSQEMELLSCNTEKIQETKTPKKKFLIFQETETIKNLLIFRGTNPFSPSSEIFGKWNFLTLTLKNFLHFSKRKLFLYFWNWNLGLSQKIFP